MIKGNYRCEMLPIVLYRLEEPLNSSLLLLCKVPECQETILISLQNKDLLLENWLKTKFLATYRTQDCPQTQIEGRISLPSLTKQGCWITKQACTQITTQVPNTRTANTWQLKIAQSSCNQSPQFKVNLHLLVLKLIPQQLLLTGLPSQIRNTRGTGL